MDLVLKFDEMDTKLAQDYIEDKVFEISSEEEIPISKRKYEMSKNFNYKVCVNDLDIYSKPIGDIATSAYTKLCEIIDSNMDLIIQLEYLIRGFLPKDTRNDVEILKHCLTGLSDKPYLARGSLTMSKSTPLYNLVRAIAIWNYKEQRAIMATIDSAPICTLFADMCFSAGIPKIAMCFTADELNELTTNKLYSGGVVTEYADIDSAVDVFISTATQYRCGWRLRHIIVQENVYECFKKSLKFKARNLHGSSNERVAICDIYYLDGPAACEINIDGRDCLFLFDHSAQHVFKSPNYIYVECYRTTKEALSLVNKYKPLYISVWCADMSTCNEIVHNVRASVSINGFGDFIHCPRFVDMLIRPILFHANESISNKEILELLTKWNRKSIAERKVVVIRCLEAIINRKVFLTNEILIKLKEFINNINLENNIKVNNNKIEVRLTMMNNLYYVESDSHDSIVSFLLALLCGNGVVMPFHSLSWKFDEFDIPVLKKEFEINELCPESLFRYIWSNFGETFAN